MALMNAKDGAGGFKKPDVSQFVPDGMQEVVQRIVAAGVKTMYSPDMRDELEEAVGMNTPASQRMAESVTGLVLVLDQQVKGGIPMEALFPAGLALLGEAAAVLEAAGESIDQATYNEAAQMLYVLMAKKLGASDEQIVQGAEQAVAKRNGGEMPAEAPAEEEMP